MISTTCSLAVGQPVRKNCKQFSSELWQEKFRGSFEPGFIDFFQFFLFMALKGWISWLSKEKVQNYLLPQILIYSYYPGY
jgi:hypothetical protein